jgi:hypothetical protein
LKSISKVEKSQIEIDEGLAPKNLDFMKSALMLGEIHRLGEDRMNEIIAQVLENKRDRT